ncbi:hypothetical protein K5Y32_14895 [Pantoea sp. DY-15]|uniref:GT99 family glycosyltransferase N-terminal domain-containing protein n=1 Tax=Pantoea sp. DY-15 TaxID=2871489 RepID=UPI001C94D442|nr:hypothetical protein [Pantoea sp. DY-15]MBY4889232.1 hypothetical protein [Pantoea sp. DY-15]
MVSKKSKYLFFWLPYDVKYSYETFLTAFYLSVKRFPSDDALHIGHEKIFQSVPSHIPNNWLQDFNSSLPTDDELKNLDKILWTNEVFSTLEQEVKSKNIVWEHILTREYEPLMKLFEEQLQEIRNDCDVKAIVLWSNCPSIKAIAKKYNIPVIHNEMGPLRGPTYLPTCYFDFSGVNGNTESASRYENYKSAEDNYSKLGRTALLSLFLKDVKPIRNFDEYEIGVPLQVEDDSNIIAFSNGFDNTELINYSKSKYNDVLIRQHPFGRVEYKDIVTGSENYTPQEFIALCRKIITINSSMGLEAMLWGKPSEIIGDSPFAFINKYDDLFIEKLRFALLNYLVPFDFLFNKEYYDWRITFPGEDNIAEKHLFFYAESKHGWKKSNIKISEMATDLESIYFRNLSLQFKDIEKKLNANIEKKNEELKAFNSNAELLIIKNEILEIKSKNKELADQLWYHQHVLSKVYDSKSWRLTKPLRSINSLKIKWCKPIQVRQKIMRLIIAVAKKSLSNYQVRKLVVFVAKKSGLYGKLKSLYLHGVNNNKSSVVSVRDENDNSRDTLINMKKIKMLKKQRGNE